MGHRANFVIVAEGRPEVWLDRWGALGLPSSLLAGPEQWERAVRATSRHADRPYDSVWAEGGVLVDQDRMVLRFYSDISFIQESVGLRRAFLPLLGELWPGWQVSYAHRGLADLLEGTPVDISGLLPHRPVPTALGPDELRAALETVTHVLGNPVDLPHYLEIASPFEGLLQLQGYAATVLTVRGADGAVRDHVGGMDPLAALAAGPHLVTMLRDAPTAAVPGEQYVGAGAWVDVTTRSVAFWGRRRGPDLGELAARWPGWHLTEHHDGLPEQLRLSGRDGAPVQLPWRVVLAEACAMFQPVGADGEQAHQGLLLEGPDWPGRRGLTDPEIAILRRLSRDGPVEPRARSTPRDPPPHPERLEAPRR